MNNILQNTLESTDINEIVNGTIRICGEICKNEPQEDISEILIVLEECIKISDIVLIKDILEYELQDLL